MAWSCTSTWPERAAAFAKTVCSPTRQSCATWTCAISRLSEPIRVKPPPPAVPRCTVAPSRNVLRSPISTREASPRNFRSCGTRPIELNGKKRLRSPTRVSPSITTLESSSVPRAQPHQRADHAEGPNPHARLERRPARHAGERVHLGRRQRRHLQQQPGLGRARLPHPHLTVEAHQLAAAVHQPHLQAQLVAGHHLAAELRLVEADDPDLDRARVGSRLQQEDARGLGQALEDQHAGHHRLAREVAGEEILAARHVLGRDQPPRAIVLEDAVDEHEGVLGR